MSSLYMRMQPYEAYLPIDSGRFVPWIAYSPPDRVKAATPIWLFGAPPGMTSGRSGLSSRTSSGGDHAGRRCLPATATWPTHCLAGRPTGDRVAHCTSILDDEVETALSSLNDNGARRDAGREGHHVASSGDARTARY